MFSKSKTPFEYFSSATYEIAIPSDINTYKRDMSVTALNLAKSKNKETGERLQTQRI